METKKHIEITIIMDESEALWLKGIMQNPISHERDPIYEEMEDKAMRKMFWDILTREIG